MQISLRKIKTSGWQDRLVFENQRKILRREVGTCWQLVVQQADRVFYGDAAVVQYAGRCGRATDNITLEDFGVTKMEGVLNSLFKQGLDFDDPRQAATLIEAGLSEINGLNITAMMYGVSQLLIQQYSADSKQEIPNYVLDLYQVQGTAANSNTIEILSQTDNTNLAIVEDMYKRGAHILPHANFCTADIAGLDLEHVRKYLASIVQILQAQQATKDTTLHLDLYGVIGDVCHMNKERVLNILLELEALATPFYRLQIESPVICDSQEEQYQYMQILSHELKKQGSKVQLIIDEWCNSLDDIKQAVTMKVADLAQIKVPDLGSLFNSIEAILFCQKMGTKTYLGGTSNETMHSADISYLSTIPFKPDQILAKPGMDPAVAIPFCQHKIQQCSDLLKTSQQGRLETSSIAQTV